MKLTRNRLNGINKALSELNQLLPYGPGNRKESVSKSKGISYMRAIWRRDILYKKYFNYLHHINNSEMKYKKRVCYLTMFAQGGNCYEFNSLFALLLNKYTNGLQITCINCGIWDHYFIVIGNPKYLKSCIILDAWDQSYNFKEYGNCKEYYSEKNTSEFSIISNNKDLLKNYKSFDNNCKKNKFRPNSRMNDFIWELY